MSGDDFDYSKAAQAERERYGWQEEVERLRNRVEALEDELAELKAGDTTDAGSGGSGKFTDARDAAVIDALEPGANVTLQNLQFLYRSRTDIRAEDTLQSRIKHLTKTPLFERDQNGWTFVGEGTDE